MIVNNKKDVGVIKLSVRNLKSVARMSVKDRGDIVKILKTRKEKEGSSSTSTGKKAKVNA